MEKWLHCAILFILLKLSLAFRSAQKEMEAIPLRKSLGYCVSEKKMGHSYVDAAISSKYVNMYQGVMKLSITASRKDEEEEEGVTEKKRLRRPTSVDTDIMQRHSQSKEQRRNKLNVQGLQSHREHSGLAQNEDE